MNIADNGRFGNLLTAPPRGDSPPPAERVLYTRRQAAEFFSVSDRTIDAWAKAGRLTPTRFGRVVRFHVNELQRVAREGIG